MNMIKITTEEKKENITKTRTTEKESEVTNVIKEEKRTEILLGEKFRSLIIFLLLLVKYWNGC